jgi:hypothetical protein
VLLAPILRLNRQLATGETARRLDTVFHPLATTLGGDGLSDTKALRRQARRQAKRPEQADGTDRPDWTAPLFRYTAKVSRQVLRFFRHCFLKPACPALYERELRPLLMAYL